MSMFDNLADQAKNLAKDHTEDLQNAAGQAAQQVGSTVDQATGGQFSDQIQQVQSQAGDQVGQYLGGSSDGTETDGGSPTDADQDPFGDASGVTESDVDAAFPAE